MKKVITSMVAIALISATFATGAKADEEERGGFMGFVAGCCLGARAAMDYNEGKEIHMRDWLRIIYVGVIWDAIDGAQGKTRADFVEEYGSTYY